WGGGCLSCPKRSGNLPGSEGSPNVCTDLACFARKEKAGAELKAREWEAAGRKVVRTPAGDYRTDEKFPSPDQAIYGCDYNSPAYGKSFEKLLKKELPKVLVVTDAGASERVDKERALELLREKGLLGKVKRGGK